MQSLYCWELLSGRGVSGAGVFGGELLRRDQPDLNVGVHAVPCGVRVRGGEHGTVAVLGGLLHQRDGAGDMRALRCGHVPARVGGERVRGL